MVDYKTDPISVPALATRYAAQVRQYAAAWSRFTATPITLAGLFGIHHGNFLERLVASPGCGDRPRSLRSWHSRVDPGKTDRTKRTPWHPLDLKSSLTRAPASSRWTNRSS